MVFQSTNTPYRYVTPVSPDSCGTEKKPTVNGHYKLSKTKLPTPTSNDGRKSSFDCQGIQKMPTSPAPPTASRQMHMQAVVVGRTLNPAQCAGHQYISTEEDTTTVAGLKSRVPHAEKNPPLNVDQRQKADAAAQHLQSVMQHIFEAEDHLQPDTSGAVTVGGNNTFTLRYTEDGQVLVLHNETQKSLETAVRKAAAYGRLDSIPVENLARVQKVCENGVHAVEASALQIGDGWSEQDIEEWASKVAGAENSLCASRALLRIMTAGRREKELQSEDFLRAVLDSLNNIVEMCILPIIEERSGDKVKGEKASSNPKFAVAASNRKMLQTLLSSATKCLRLLGELLVKTDVDERSISSVEYLCKTLIFAENGSSERESALGIQTFETMRKSAMDVLAQIFTRYTDQRSFIFDEILLSLERLPATKQSSRQYKLIDAKPIQLVSALLMRLVQTSATKTADALHLKSSAKNEGAEDAEASDSDAAADDEKSEEESDDEVEIKVSSSKKTQKLGNFESVAKSLYDSAQQNASYIIKVLVQRALSTSKSSDEPYRKLLDIFTEDFLNVLGSPEWPAAEMLLRTLLGSMVNLAENTKNAVPSRLLALELLGTMGSGILELQSTASKAAKSLEVQESALAGKLVQMVEQIERGEEASLGFLSFDGPFRIILEYLRGRDTGDAQLQTARGLLLMQWAHNFWDRREGSTDTDDAGPNTQKDLQSKIRRMVLDTHWLEEHYDFPEVATSEGRLAAAVVTLNSRFCKAFKRLFNILLAATNSDAPTIRSRGLKSVVTLLEQDPSLLDRSGYVLGYIFRCCNDASPLVRDSALGLIAKCVSLRPRLDGNVCEKVIERTHDAATGVRKRAMKLLKEIYLRNESKGLRSAIANAIITRVQDTDESVTELARLTMEEIWFEPFHAIKIEGDGAVQAKLKYRSQMLLVVQTVELGEKVYKVLQSLLHEVLNNSKASAANERVCRVLVAMNFDAIIDTGNATDVPSQDSIVRALTIFAKAEPNLFTASQLERLEPYTQNLINSDDLVIYRSVITIFRYVMPHQTSLRPEFLMKIQQSLLASVPKIPQAELAEVAPCLWTIDGILKNTEKLEKFMVSVLTNVDKSRSVDLSSDQATMSKVNRLLAIAGHFGKACDFNERLVNFKERFTWYKGNSVPGLAVEIFCSYTSPKRPLAVREAALEAVCRVAQAWPKQFLRQDVTTAFELVFKDAVPSLELVLLRGLEGFFCADEDSGGETDGIAIGGGIATGDDRLGKTYQASDQDGASTSIAQRFLPQILRLSLASCDDMALVATKLIASINRQGLVHPKESGPALVALETCPVPDIANRAFAEHRGMHHKHESMLEKEYMRAVQQAVTYQQHVIGSPTGFTGKPPVSKLHLLWDVLKSGSAKVRKKFLTNICQKLDFDPVKLDTSVAVPDHLVLTRFCTENLAFFDYDKVEELLHLVAALEKAFANTGTSVAQSIESEILKLKVNMESDTFAVAHDGTSDTLPFERLPTPTDPLRLRHFTICVQILYLIWETRTFIRRLWNLQKHSATKAKAKETAKQPTRATNTASHTDAYLHRVTDIMAATSTSEAQHALCASFVDLISIDNEVKVDASSDGGAAAADGAAGYDTPSEGTSGKSPSLPPSGGGGRGTKRKSIDAAGGAAPKKRARKGLKKTASGRMGGEDEE